LPNVPETYVHRIGRTARAGNSGVAWSFCDLEERPFLADIERLIRRHIERVEDHSYPPTQRPPAETDLASKSSGKSKSGGGGGKSRGGGGGGRGGGGKSPASKGRRGGGRSGPSRSV